MTIFKDKIVKMKSKQGMTTNMSNDNLGYFWMIMGYDELWCSKILGQVFKQEDPKKTRYPLPMMMINKSISKNKLWKYENMKTGRESRYQMQRWEDLPTSTTSRIESMINII